MDRLEAFIDGDEGPFDALLGFSQGAILITMLTARRLQRAQRGLAPPPTWSARFLANFQSSEKFSMSSVQTVREQPDLVKL